MVFMGAVFLAVLSSVAVLLRFISRGRILHILGPTDWFIAVTLVSNTPTPQAGVSRDRPPFPC
jgi:hypothetical protein